MATTETEEDTNNSTSEKLALLDFFNNPRVVSLFTVLVGTGTIISLLPLFLGFLLNSNDWLSQLLATSLGYFTFLLILIAVYLSVIFMLFISGNIFSEFYTQVIKKPYSASDKLFASITVICVLLSFFAISLVLINIWAIKAISTFNFLSSLTLIYLGLLAGTILFGVGIAIILTATRENSGSPRLDPAKKIKVLRWGLIILLLILFSLLGYFLFTILSGPTTLILNYYNDTDKSITINLSYNESIGIKHLQSFIFGKLQRM